VNNLVGVKFLIFILKKKFDNNKTPFKVVIYGDQGADPQAGPIINRVTKLIQVIRLTLLYMMEIFLMMMAFNKGGIDI